MVKGYPSQGLSVQFYTWEEIRRHKTKEDRWIVVDDVVYDVSRWCKRHPGGEKLLAHFAGEDATDAWVAFHNDKGYVSKFMKPLIVGQVKRNPENEIAVSTPAIVEDYRKLRKTAEEMDLFRSDKLFFAAIVGHILLLDLLGWFIMWYFGTSWLPYIVAAVLLTAAQAQAGWSQHDFGHLSVFENNTLNHAAHIFILNFLKGASAHWWNYRHYQHHAKPNIIRKDPDIRLDYLFLIGKTLPKEWGRKKKGVVPYNHQHTYFYFILPPLLLPLYFNFEIPYYMIKRRLWKEMFWTSTFFLRWQIMFSSLLGFWGVFGLFLFVRFLESHWFVWCTQMNHIPMEVEYEREQDWLTMQLAATCNIDQSFFNDWFSGHLNFQIEHHLFPTMPRHNYHKIAPLVKSLCEKHGLEYQSKPLLRAFADIVRSLKVSGKMWYEAYHM